MMTKINGQLPDSCHSISRSSGRYSISSILLVHRGGDGVAIVATEEENWTMDIRGDFFFAVSSFRCLIGQKHSP